MTDTKPLRQVVVYAIIGSFSVAALLGVVALLSGGSVGGPEVRILLTTLVVGCASVAVLLDLSTAGTPYRPVGVAGAATAAVPTVTALLMVWGSPENGPGDVLVKTFLVGLVVAATLSQLSVLLVLGSRRAGIGLVPWSTIGVAVLFGCSSTALVLGGDPGEGGIRLYGVLAILDVLGTVVTIALAVFGGRVEPPAEAAWTVPPALAARLDEEVRRSGRSRDEIVSAALDAYLEQRSGS